LQKNKKKELSISTLFYRIIRMKETEIAEKIVNWLVAQHWNVYQEVQLSYMGNIADIMAERQGVLWVIETKLVMSMDVLNQASSWTTHFRSIAVPKSLSKAKRNKRDYGVAKHYYMVGVLEIDGDYIDEVLKPPLYLTHHKAAKKILSKLTELHKTYSKAGSYGGGHLTPYKMTMIKIKETIGKYPGCTIDDLFRINGPLHYAHKGSFKGNVLKCLEQYENDWCIVNKEQKPYRLFIRE
jgi:hypothetical protein